MQVRVPPAPFRLLALAVLGACVLPGPVAGREVNAMPDSEAIARFKTRIGFADSLPGDAAGRGVAVVWPDPQTFAYFKGGGWSTIVDTVSVVKPGLVERNWVLRRGRDAIDLRIVVSSAGNAAARAHLVDIAAATMMQEVPYEAMPRRLGDLSVETRDMPPLHRMIWVDRNVCVYLTRTFGADLPRLADEIQGFVAKQPAEDLASRSPALQALEISGPGVAVGDSLRATVRAPALGALAGLLVAFSDPEHRVQVIDQSGLGATLQGTAPGPTTLHGTVADRATLLSADVAANVTVRTP